MMKRALTTVLSLALCVTACGNVPPVGGGGGAGGTPGDAGFPLPLAVTGMGLIFNDAGAIPVHLTGALTIDRFTTENGQVVAVGTLRGQITNPLGNVVGVLAPTPVTLPIIAATGTCEILQLDLGPLRVNLPGITVDLTAIHLDITAESGSGNLVDNLLCAIADLINGGGTLNAITGLLNDLLRALNGNR